MLISAKNKKEGVPLETQPAARRDGGGATVGACPADADNSAVHHRTATPAGTRTRPARAERAHRRPAPAGGTACTGGTHSRIRSAVLPDRPRALGRRAGRSLPVGCL